MIYMIDPTPTNNGKSGLFILLIIFLITVTFLVARVDPLDKGPVTFGGAGNTEKPQAEVRMPEITPGIPVGSEPFYTYTPVPLVNAVDQNQLAVGFTLLSALFVLPPENLTFDNIPFQVSPTSLVVETESQTSANASTIFIPANIYGPRRVDLLINLSYGSPRFTGGQPVVGSQVCRITLYTDHGSKSFSLVAGEELREWVYSSSGVVNSTGSQTRLAFQGQHNPSGQEAGIDQLTLTLPVDWADDTLKLIIIEDLSQELFSSPDPGIMLFAITVETISPGN